MVRDTMHRSPSKPLASPGKSQQHSLLAACRIGDLQTAQAAVAQLSTALAKATTSTDRTRVHLALSASEPAGWTALLYAARNGWADLAQQLLAAMPSLATASNAKLGSSGNTVLHVASMHGHLAVVQHVLKALQQHQQQQSSRSPLSSPITSPNSKSAAAIRRSRDSTTPPVSPRNSSNAQQQQQPGALQQQQQQQQHVAALSPKGSGAVPGVDARNSNGDTPLMFAASSGHMGIVAALLNAGAAAAAANAVGITPLLAAAGHGQAGCVQLLLRHVGPHAWQQLLAAKDAYGRTALHFAAASGHSLVVEVLLSSPAGLEVWAVSAAGRSALQEAQQSGHTHCARLILPAMEQAAAAAEAVAAELTQQQQDAGLRSPGSTKGRSSSRPHTLTIPAAGGGLTSPKQQRRSSVSVSVPGKHSEAGSAAGKQHSAAAAAGAGSVVAAVGACGHVGDTSCHAAAASSNRADEGAADSSGDDVEQQPDTAAAAAGAVHEEAAPEGVSAGAIPAGSAHGDGSDEAGWTAVTPARQRKASRAGGAGGSAAPNQQQHQQQQDVVRLAAVQQAAAAATPNTRRGAAADAATRSAAARRTSSAAGAAAARRSAAGSSSGGGVSQPSTPAAASETAGAAPPLSTSYSDALARRQQQLVSSPADAISGDAEQTGPGSDTAQQQQQQQPGWWDAALCLMAAAAPAAAALDLQPPHVLGCGLAELSMSQLDALELVHRASLVRLGEARIALACQQHEQEAAEQARLRAEIAAHAAARQQQQQQQHAVVAALAGSEGGASQA